MITKLQAIYASKIYKSSKYKDCVNSAIENPINVELVQQLSEYLDVDSIKTSEPLKVTFYEKTTPSTADEHIEETPIPEEPMAELSTEEMPIVEDTAVEDVVENATSDEPTTTDANSSVSAITKDTAIIAASAVNNISVDSFHSKTQLNTLSKDIATEIMGTLNSRQSTCGVTRVVAKGNELWIYYNDKINLNNVMSDIIDLLDAANYTYLNFNRLARSENAIVFEITFYATTKTVNSLSEVADDE